MHKVVRRESNNKLIGYRKCQESAKKAPRMPLADRGRAREKEKEKDGQKDGKKIQNLVSIE